MLRLICLAALSLVAATAYSADPPRYKLPVGRVLYYSGEGSSKENDGKTPAECIANTRDIFTTTLAVMLEQDLTPPPPADEGWRYLGSQRQGRW